MRKTVTLSPVVYAAFEAYALTQNEAVKRLREALIEAGIPTVEDAEPYVTAWASKRYGVPLVEGTKIAAGRLILDKTAAKYEAARKARQRIMDDLRGDADADAAEAAEAKNNKTEQFEIPEEIAAIAAQLVAACREYDLDKSGLKRLAAQAVAAAFAAKQAK